MINLSIWEEFPLFTKPVWVTLNSKIATITAHCYWWSYLLRKISFKHLLWCVTCSRNAMRDTLNSDVYFFSTLKTFYSAIFTCSLWFFYFSVNGSYNFVYTLTLGLLTPKLGKSYWIGFLPRQKIEFLLSINWVNDCLMQM